MNPLLRWIPAVSLLAVAPLWGAEPTSTPSKAETWFRSHFAGQAAIKASTNGATFQKVAGLASSKTIARLVAERLAATPAKLWKAQLPAAAAQHNPLLQDLFLDLYEAESLLDLRRSSDQWHLSAAFRLPPDRASLWNTNLWQLISRWQLGKPKSLSLENATGWETPPAQSGFAFQFLHIKDWVLLSAGTVRPPLPPRWLKEVASSGRPAPALTNEWLVLDVAGAFLKSFLPNTSELLLPSIHLTLGGEGENVRTLAELEFAKPLPITLEDWDFPASMIQDPLVSFTVVRGINPWLQISPIPNKLGMSTLPNQVCSWGQPTFQGQTVLVFPSPSPTNELRRIGPHVQPWLESVFGDEIPKVQVGTNAAYILWNRLTFLQPFVRPLVLDSNHAYLVAGLVPNLGKSNPPPATLFNQLSGKTNLLYYGWEITESRLTHHRHYLQLGSLVGHFDELSTNEISFIWLEDIRKLLGNTITEISFTRPQRLSFSRRSHLGLTGMELVYLARWIDIAGFPFSFQLPKSKLHSPSQTKTTNAPPKRTVPGARPGTPVPPPPPKVPPRIPPPRP